MTYPAPAAPLHLCGDDQIALPLRLRVDQGLPSFWSTTLVFGGPLDVSLSELMLEIFLPADAQTAARMAALCGGRSTVPDNDKG
jgi:hypothetical protein